MSNGAGIHGKRRLPRSQRTASLCETELDSLPQVPGDVESTGRPHRSLFQTNETHTRPPLSRVPSDHSTDATSPDIPQVAKGPSKHHRAPSMCFESGTVEPPRGQHSHVLSEASGSRGDFQMPPELLETYEVPKATLELIVDAVDFSDPRHSQVCTPSGHKSASKSRSNSKHLKENVPFQSSGTSYCPKCRRRVNTESGVQRVEVKGKQRRVKVVRCVLCLYIISKLS